MPVFPMGTRGLPWASMTPQLFGSVPNWQAKGDMLNLLGLGAPPGGMGAGGPGWPAGLLGGRELDQRYGAPYTPAAQQAPAPIQPRTKPPVVVRPAARTAKKKLRLTPHMRREMMTPGFGPSQ